MKQVDKFGGKVSGAASSDLCNAHAIAEEVYGTACEDENSGLIAFSYLWRRFGPPFLGSDDYKELCSYYLTTEDERVFLNVSPKGSGLKYGVGYMVYRDVIDEFEAPQRKWNEDFQVWIKSKHPDYKKDPEVLWDLDLQEEAEKELGVFPPQKRWKKDWRAEGGIIQRVSSAIFGAMKELLVPVYIRDVCINILGCCEDTDNPSEKSIYAGYGVPKDAMDKYFKEQEKNDRTR